MTYRKFVFGETLERALDAIPEEHQLRFYKIVKDYGLHGIEPELSGFELSTWVQMKDVIDNTMPKQDVDQSPIKKPGAPFGNNNAKKQKSETTETIKNNSEQLKQPETTLPNGNGNGNGNENTNSFPAEAESEISVSAEKSDSPSPAEKKPSGKVPLTEREPVNDYERVEKRYLENWKTLFQQGRVKSAEPVFSWGQTRSLLKTLFGKVKPEQIIGAIDRAVTDDWIVSNGYSFGTILSATVFNRLLNATAPPAGSFSQSSQPKTALGGFVI